MKLPLIKRSIRWKLLGMMLCICALFSITLTVIHTRAINDVKTQAIKHIQLLDKARLFDRGHLISRDLKRQAENDIASFSDSIIQETVNDLMDENPDISYVIITEISTEDSPVRSFQTDMAQWDPPELNLKSEFAVRSTHEYEYRGNGIIEFIEPIYLGHEIWGVLRLGFSTVPMKKDMSNIKAEMLKSTNSMITRSIQYSLLLLLTGTLVILYLSGKLTEPIARLTESVQKFAQGNFSATSGINADSHDEVGKLSNAFFTMTGQLQRTYLDLKKTAEEARRTETFLDSILENLPHMVFVKDARDLKFVLINKAGEALVGHPREQLLGKNDYDFFKREQADFFTSMDRKVLESGHIMDIPEETLTKSDGRVRFLHTMKIPILAADNQAQYLLGISEDITDIKSAAEERRLFFNHSMDLMCIANLDGYFEQVNPAFIETLGYTREELCTRPYINFVHPDDRENTDVETRRLNEGCTVISFENRYICKDGSIRWLTWNAGINREFKKVYAVARDTTKQRNMEEQIFQAGLKEQERIAHDLHDGLGQILTAIAYKGKLMEQMIRDQEIPAAAQASDVVRLANLASEQARILARGLDPVILKEGLTMALKDLSHSTSETFGINCTFEYDQESESIEKSTANHLFRIAQEAVNNAVKHGTSKSVSIYLTNDKSTITLVIMNDGSVFPGMNNNSSGLGIRTMNYRAKLIGGALAIIPNPTGGLIVRCTLRKTSDHAASLDQGSS